MMQEMSLNIETGIFEAMKRYAKLNVRISNHRNSKPVLIITIEACSTITEPKCIFRVTMINSSHPKD